MTQFGGGGSPADTELPTAEEPGDGDPNVASPAVTARMQAWYGAAWTRVPLFDGPTLASDLGFGVHINSSTVITTRPETTLTIQPAANADAAFIRLVPMGQVDTANAISVVPSTDYNATSIPLANARSMVVRLPRTGRITTAEAQAVTLTSDHEGLDPALPLAVRQSDGLSFYDGASETTAANIYARLGDRRTSDGAASGGGQVVRPLFDVATFTQTTPGTPTWYLQVRNAPGRLKSCKVTLQTTGTPFYVFVMDVSNYLPPPAAQPAITTRRHLGFANKGTGNDPGIYIVSFDREEFQTYTNGILIVLSTTASTFTPATAALASVEAYSLAVPS